MRRDLGRSARALGTAASRPRTAAPRRDVHGAPQRVVARAAESSSARSRRSCLATGTSTSSPSGRQRHRASRRRRAPRAHVALASARGASGRRRRPRGAAARGRRRRRRRRDTSAIEPTRAASRQVKAALVATAQCVEDLESLVARADVLDDLLALVVGRPRVPSSSSGRGPTACFRNPSSSASPPHAPGSSSPARASSARPSSARERRLPPRDVVAAAARGRPGFAASWSALGAPGDRGRGPAAYAAGLAARAAR